MAGIKQSWAIGGSLFLAAATGLVTVGGASPLLGQEAVISDQPVLATPRAMVDAPLASPYYSSGAFQNSAPYCAPSQTSRYSRCRTKYWGYPEEFCTPPLGSNLMGYQAIQVANAQAARMVLYRYDFVPSSDQLTARGKSQVAKVALWLTTNGSPVFVEPTLAGPELDELRRQSVWRELSTKHFSVPNERILVGHPNVRGLDASDAMSIDRNRLGQTSSRGASATGTAGTSVTTSGAAGTTGAR